MNTKDNLKRYYALIFTLVFVTSCSILFGRKCDWDFITSVGGIKIDDPYLTKEGWYMPIQCDVSGLQKITNEPTTLNSALRCVRVSFSKEDFSIFFTVYAGSIGYNNRTSECKGINIGQIEEGEYKVYYKYEDDLHFIRNIQINNN